MNEIGKLMKALREEKGMSQAELGVLLNCSKQTISNYESGRRRPAYETLEAACDVFNVPRAYFFTEEEKRQQSENKLKAGKMWDNSMNLVFTREDGSPMPHTTIENDFKRIARKIGRPELSFHALRHTYATEEIASGTDPKTVADSLGHSTVAMTMNVYAAAVTETKIKAANRRQKQHEERENTASG